jgi:hypothetical protein
LWYDYPGYYYPYYYAPYQVCDYYDTSAPGSGEYTAPAAGATAQAPAAPQVCGQWVWDAPLNKYDWVTQACLTGS